MKVKEVIGEEVAQKGLCKDCKYFNRENGKYSGSDIKGFGVCESGKIGYLSGDYTDDMLVYEDSEEYWAYHRVGENFGCVHFEERENVD